jgi:uncharacterized protein YlxW (UPF0749 family)
VSNIDRITETEQNFVAESRAAAFSRKEAELKKFIKDLQQENRALMDKLRLAEKRLSAYQQVSTAGTAAQALNQKCREIEHLLKTAKKEAGFWEQTHRELVAARMAYLEEVHNPPEEPDVE